MADDMDSEGQVAETVAVNDIALNIRQVSDGGYWLQHYIDDQEFGAYTVASNIDDPLGQQKAFAQLVEILAEYVFLVEDGWKMALLPDYRPES